MTEKIAERHQESRRIWLQYLIAVFGLGLVLWLALRTIDIKELWQVIITANLWWLLAAVVFKLLAPLGTAALYASVLRLLGHRIHAMSLWLIAQMAIVINMAFPAGPVAMSAFLIHVFRRRRVPEGITTVAVALDSLTYETAFLGLVSFGLAYLFTHRSLSVGQITEVGLLTFAIVLGGMYLWGLQRDRADLTRKAIAIQQWLARHLRQHWQPVSVEHFLDELYRSKALVAQRPTAFARLLVIQIGVLALDILTLYCIFRAVGNDPHLSVIILSYSLASFFAALAPLPGGGGSFEATLVLVASQLGIPSAVSLGVTLIYRVLVFWLPGIVTVAGYRLVLNDTLKHHNQL
ncbi:lysylphosphatidylglycerol synthase transmembrane domain-containing protein [Chloroflexus sp.]|uniref:lysylphosphatidylglycerol synthase transmembrane domain-containing protein n=1 Tax=Chloroflexus sp. TaxID=1904827 RepID=UPI00298F06E6|nr:lysylphosphatidylglycerol synthase transmembrane domain-containing protein [Chloroflexus sp.]MDW8402986.1 lysylphosphatidylglycerol synthase transmembrane domain-containing protein [Chloroflexus sp.]